MYIWWYLMDSGLRYMSFFFIIIIFYFLADASCLKNQKNLKIQKFLSQLLPGEWLLFDYLLILTREVLEIKKEKEQKGVLEAHKGFSDNCSFLSMCHICLQSSPSFRSSSLAEIVSHLLWIKLHLQPADVPLVKSWRSLKADSAPENATGPQQSVLKEQRFLTGVRIRF